MESAADSASLEKPTVVVVDDDPAVRRSLKFSLELEGFSVRTYSDATDLLKGNAAAPWLLGHRLQLADDERA